MANTKAAKKATTGQAKDLDGLRQRLQEIQSRREAAQAAFDKAEAQFNADLGASALGELTAAKLAKSRAARDQAAEDLAGLDAAVGELERRIGAAEAKQTEAKKAALLSEIRGRVKEAKSIVGKALEIDGIMTGLGERMGEAVRAIGEYVSQYRDLSGTSPCEFPALHAELIQGLRANKSGIRTGTPDFIATIWGSQQQWRSFDHPIEVDTKGRPQEADSGAA